MPAMFSIEELGQLVSTGIMSDDPRPLLRVAVKACLSNQVPLRVVLLATQSVLEAVDRSTLRRSFRELARLDQLDELAVLSRHRSRDVRLALIHAFYNFGRRSHITALEPLRVDDDAAIRRQAQEAIENIGNPSNLPVFQLVESTSLDDTEHLVARLMLKQVSSNDTVGVTRLLFADSRALRRLAREALAREHLSDIVVTTIEQCLTSGQPLTEEAADALQDLGDVRSARVLMHALVGSAESRGHATTALKDMGPIAGTVLLQAFRTDPSAFSDGRLLAETAGPSALDALLKALESPRRVVRETAADGLFALGTVSVPSLLALAQRSGDESVVDVLAILGRLAPPDAFETVLRHTRSANSVVGAAAIRALAKYQHAAAQDVLATALQSPDRHMRYAAATALGDWHWRNVALVGLLSDVTINDPYPRVREAAKHSLQRMAQEFLGAHAMQLANLVESGDEAARAAAEDEIRQLRGVLAFYFDSPRLFASEGYDDHRQLRNRIQQIADLTPYAAWLERPLGRVLSAPMTLGPAVNAGPAAGARRDDPVAVPSLDFSARDVPSPITDDVRFSVTSPTTVLRQQACVLDVWAHTADDYQVVLDYVRRDPRAHSGASLRSKGPIPVERGTTLAVRVCVPDLQWEGEDSLYWAGTVGNATFAFTVPSDTREGDHSGLVQVYAAGIQIARVTFLIGVANTEGTVHDVTSRQQRITTAFASYASEDRNQVLARIQGMLSIVPDLDIFMDVMALRSGERWQDRLEAEIAKRDVLYLFWSSAARASVWVEREWRTALRTKGLNGIDPVPLETPDKAPPPPELTGLHFNQWTLQIRN
jgi:HEAT repeat protein